MKLYVVRIAPDVSQGEGEYHDQWFSSLRKAAACRAKCLLTVDWAQHRYGRDFEIQEVELANDLSPRELLLAVLNRRGYVNSRRVVCRRQNHPEGRAHETDKAEWRAYPLRQRALFGDASRCSAVRRLGTW